MAITSVDGYAAALRQRCRVLKLSQALTPGRSFSLWKLSGNPGAGATPPSGNGEVPTKASPGALVWANPTGGAKTYLDSMAMAAGRGMHIVTLYDRLWHNSGFSGSVTTAQTISTPPTLTRPDALGTGAQLWAEIYSQPGTTAATFTATYTNQSGTGGRTATATCPGGVVAVGTMLPFLLQDGDTGVRTVNQVQLSASTGGAGNFGLVIARDIQDISVGMDGIGDFIDFFQGGGPQVHDSACLALRIQIANTGTMGDLIGSIVLTQG